MVDPKESKLFMNYLKEEGVTEVLIEPMPQNNAPLSTTSSLSPSAVSSVKEAMIKLRDEILPCTKCSELASTRNSVVFGSGNLKAKLMFVGEAPGADEDVQGLPFVGRAGQLLTKIIESINISREKVFIANVLKCRPPGNRPPAADEIANCEGYLFRQIELINPQIICCLGTFAAQTLLKTDTPIGQLRGQFFPWRNTKLICTYHPAYLLRNPPEKRKVWEDMKLIRAELDRQTI